MIMESAKYAGLFDSDSDDDLFSRRSCQRTRTPARRSNEELVEPEPALFPDTSSTSSATDYIAGLNSEDSKLFVRKKVGEIADSQTAGNVVPTSTTQSPSPTVKPQTDRNNSKSNDSQYDRELFEEDVGDVIYDGVRRDDKSIYIPVDAFATKDNNNLDLDLESNLVEFLVPDDLTSLKTMLQKEPQSSTEETEQHSPKTEPQTLTMEPHSTPTMHSTHTMEPHSTHTMEPHSTPTMQPHCPGITPPKPKPRTSSLNTPPRPQPRQRVLAKQSSEPQTVIQTKPKPPLKPKPRPSSSKGSIPSSTMPTPSSAGPVSSGDMTVSDILSYVSVNELSTDISAKLFD